MLESDEEFASRKAAEDEKGAGLERKLGAERRRLAQAQEAVRQDVQAACLSFRSRFASASDDKTLQQVSADFNAGIAKVIGSHLTRFGQDAVPHVEGLDADLQRVVKDTNRVANVAATIASAALAAVIIPGVGAAASAAEGAGGAAVRVAAGKTAAGAVGKKAAGAVARKAGAAVLATGAQRALTGALTAVHELNPVNMVSDVLAEWWKNRQIEEPMDQIRTELSNRAAWQVEAYFEQEVLQPLERERDDVQQTLTQLGTERRSDLADRTAKVARVDADIERLRKASQEHA